MKTIKNNKKEVYIAGSGGHAKVVIGTLFELEYHIEAMYDDDNRKQGNSFCGIPVLGSIDSFCKLQYINGIIAIGDNQIRKKIVSGCKSITWETAIHPTAYVHESVRIGEGTVVFAGAVIQPDTVIGSHVIVNTGATIDHDCMIGDYAHIAPGAHLGGQVRIGEGTLVGLSSSVIQNIAIGDWAVIGAGAAVIKELPSNVTAVGIPAQIIKQNKQ